MLRTSIFPSRYVQGAGALDSLDTELAQLVFSEHELSTAIAAALGVQLDT
ncbi:hypothetical protein [Caballeronia sp. M23-90]